MSHAYKPHYKPINNQKILTDFNYNIEKVVYLKTYSGYEFTGVVTDVNSSTITIRTGGSDLEKDTCIQYYGIKVDDISFYSFYPCYPATK